MILIHTYEPFTYYNAGFTSLFTAAVSSVSPAGRAFFVFGAKNEFKVRFFEDASILKFTLSLQPSLVF
jgi:hypothetical protein